MCIALALSAFVALVQSDKTKEKATIECIAPCVAYLRSAPVSRDLLAIRNKFIEIFQNTPFYLNIKAYVRKEEERIEEEENFDHPRAMDNGLRKL